MVPMKYYIPEFNIIDSGDLISSLLSNIISPIYVGAVCNGPKHCHIGRGKCLHV